VERLGALLAARSEGVDEGGEDGAPDPLLSVASYVPLAAAEGYAAAGVTTMHAWQRDALLQNGMAALVGQSLVVTVPTSAGKSLLAEVLMLARLHSRRGGSGGGGGARRVLFVVPLVSLVVERVAWLQRVWAGCNLNVVGFYQAKGGASLQGVDVAVATIERANGLVNRLLHDGTSDELALLVLDELHMMADKTRGCLLEGMVVKLRAAAARSAAAVAAAARSGDAADDPVSPPPPAVQVLGMSATLSNHGEVAAWLGGGAYVGTSRPLPLRCHLVLEGVQYDCDARGQGGAQGGPAGAASAALEPHKSLLPPVRVFVPLKGFEVAEPVAVVEAGGGARLPQLADEYAVVKSVCAEAVSAGRPVLVFCSSRAKAQTAAVKIAEALLKLCGVHDAALPPVFQGVPGRLKVSCTVAVLAVADRVCVRGGCSLLTLSHTFPRLRCFTPRSPTHLLHALPQAMKHDLDTVVTELRMTPHSLDEQLRKMLPAATAFHHAGELRYAVGSACGGTAHVFPAGDDNFSVIESRIVAAGVARRYDARACRCAVLRAVLQRCGVRNGAVCCAGARAARLPLRLCRTPRCDDRNAW
jgi:hypothetical protein